MPRTRFIYDLPQNEVAFEYDRRSYHKEAVYGAALVLTLQCYTFLETAGAGRSRVILRPKQGDGEAELTRLAGEFHNELLSQTLRWMVSKANKRTKDAIVTQALFAARGSRKKSAVARRRHGRKP